MDDQQQMSLAWAAKIRKEYQRLKADENHIHNQIMQEHILATWKRDSPIMWANLTKMLLTAPLVYVVQAQMWDRKKELMQAGLPVTDAREQAERETLMLETEQPQVPDDPARGGKAGGRKKAGTVKNPASVSPANTGPGAFVLDDPLKIVGGGQVARFDKSKAAIEMRNLLMDAGRNPTTEEQTALAGYTGWGSFGQELSKGNWARSDPKPGWEARDTWLRSSPARAGIGPAA